MDEPELNDLIEERLAADARIGMRKLVFEVLPQQEYFNAAAMMVAEYFIFIQRIEAGENSGNLSHSSVKAAAILGRNEIKGFNTGSGQTPMSQLPG